MSNDPMASGNEGGGGAGAGGIRAHPEPDFDFGSLDFFNVSAEEPVPGWTPPAEAEAADADGLGSETVAEAVSVVQRTIGRTTRDPVMPPPSAPPPPGFEEEVRALKRSHDSESVQARKRFASNAAHARAVGSFQLPHVPALLLSAKPPHKIVQANSEWCRWCCYRREDVIGKTLAVSHGPATERDRFQLVENAMASGHGAMAVVTCVPSSPSCFSLGRHGSLTCCLALRRNYTPAGVAFRNTLFIVPVSSNVGLRTPHFMATSSIDFPTGKPFPQPRTQLPANVPAVLFEASPPYSVVEVNNSWLQACGFQRTDVLGRTMKIIQGPLTEMDRVERLMKAVKQKVAYCVSLTNYTKAGHSFTNNLHVAPINATGIATDLSFYYATSHITYHPLRPPSPPKPPSPPSPPSLQLVPSTLSTAWNRAVVPMPGSTAMVRVPSDAPSPGKPPTGWDNAAAPSPGRRMGLALRNMMPIQPTPTAFFRQLTPTELVAQQTSRRIALKRYLGKRALRELSTLRPVGAPRAERKHASRQKIASNRPRVGGRFIKAAPNPTPAPDASSGTDSEAESEPGAPAEGAKEGPSADADATVEAVASPSERFAPPPEKKAFLDTILRCAC